MFGIKPDSVSQEDANGSKNFNKLESSVVSNHQQVAKLLQQRAQPPFGQRNEWPPIKSEIDVLDLTSKRSNEDIDDGEG